MGGSLIVQGDIYEAIYQVYNSQVLSWWEHCDAHYLGGKLAGLNGHSDEKYEWSDTKAREALAKMKTELVKEVNEELKEKYDEEVEDNKDEGKESVTFEAWKQARIEKGGEFKGAEGRLCHWQDECPEDNCSSSGEWVSFLESFGEEIFGDDFWEFAAGIGQIINPVIGIHLTALKLALKQLREKGVKLYEEPTEEKK